MPTYSSRSGRKYVTPTAPLKSGGEGAIYSITNDQSLVLKIYHPKQDYQETQEKLEMMVNNQPDQSVISQIAWPVDLIYSSKGVVGFAMPNLAGKKELVTLYPYNPSSTTQMSVSNKISIAQNICAVIDAVHKAGYVFGDFNPINIGVDPVKGFVAFFDTDSYHVINQKTNKTYRCNVCAPGYAAPELIRHMKAHPGSEYGTVPLPTFTKETDNFALAIHMFKLLMNGFTPFNGIMANHSPISAPSPGIDDEAVLMDSYCFKPGKKPMAAAVPSLSEIPAGLRDLVQRAFLDGKSDPKKRPNAAEWYLALQNYEIQLIQCNRNITHQYMKGLSVCPWCSADNRYYQGLQLTQKPFTTPLTPPKTPISPPPVVKPPQPPPSLSRARSVPKPSRPSGFFKTLFIFAFAIVFGTLVFKVFNGIPDLVNTVILGLPQSSNSYSSTTNSGTSNQVPPANQPSESEVTYQQNAPDVVVSTGDILYSCKGAFPQEFRVNSRAIVKTEQDRLIVRSSAGTDYVQLFRIYTGTIVTVLDGPECSEGSSWWYIRVDKGTEVYNPLTNRNYYLKEDSEGWVRGGAEDWRNDGESDHLRPVN